MSDQGAFDSFVSFLLKDAMQALAASITGEDYVSEIPDNFWHTEVWTYRCLISHAGTHRGQDINNGLTYSFVAGQPYEFRHKLVDPADGVVYDASKFELVHYMKYHGKTGEVIKYGI